MVGFDKVLISAAVCLLFVIGGNRAQNSSTVTAETDSSVADSDNTSTTYEASKEMETSSPPSSLPPSQGSPSASPLANGMDRECGCTRTKIWLDIVAVIDTSLSMGQEGLSQVQANLDTIVHELTLNSTPGYSSRISIVTFATNATIVAGLNVFNNSNDFENTIFNISLSNGDSKVNILAGLQAANSILEASSTQPNRRRVVILYTSAYDNAGFESPLLISKNMREDNIKLITIAFAQSMGSSDVDKVGELAYPGFALTNNQTDLINKIYDSLCQANCFCPPNWRQYSENFTDKFAHGFGICLFHSNIQAGWTPASRACRMEQPGAYLVTETNQKKHDFNYAYSQASSIDKQNSYHIGLEYINGEYSWQQSNQSVNVQINNYPYTFWNAGYPNNTVGTCVKADKIPVDQEEYKWTNEDCFTALNYICEVSACDTDSYCP